MTRSEVIGLIRKDIKRSKDQMKTEDRKLSCYFQGIRDYAQKVEFILKNLFKENK